MRLTGVVLACALACGGGRDADTGEGAPVGLALRREDWTSRHPKHGGHPGASDAGADAGAASDAGVTIDAGAPDAGCVIDDTAPIDLAFTLGGGCP